MSIRFGEMLGDADWARKRALDRQIDACWNWYRNSIRHGRTLTLERVFERLIRAGSVRVLRRRYQPPKVIVIAPRRAARRGFL